MAAADRYRRDVAAATHTTTARHSQSAAGHTQISQLCADFGRPCHSSAATQIGGYLPAGAIRRRCRLLSDYGADFARSTKSARRAIMPPTHHERPGPCRSPARSPTVGGGA